MIMISNESITIISYIKYEFFKAAYTLDDQIYINIVLLNYIYLRV